MPRTESTTTADAPVIGAGQSSGRHRGRRITRLSTEPTPAVLPGHIAGPRIAPGAAADGAQLPHREATTRLTAPPRVLDCDRSQRHPRTTGHAVQLPPSAEGTQIDSAPTPTTCQGRLAGAGPHPGQSTFSHGGGALRHRGRTSRGAATPSQRVQQVVTHAHALAAQWSRRLPIRLRPSLQRQRKQTSRHHRQTTQKKSTQLLSPSLSHAGGLRPRSRGCASTTTGLSRTIRTSTLHQARYAQSCA